MVIHEYGSKDDPLILLFAPMTVSGKDLAPVGTAATSTQSKEQGNVRHAGMPLGMWVLFAGSFREHLSSVYGYDPETAKTVAGKAKPKYKEIIGRLPEFEKADRFKMNINIVNCAILSAFLLKLPERPAVEKTTEHYCASMITTPMKWFCLMSGKKKFSEKDIQGMKDAAVLCAAERNPYSWNMEFLLYEDGGGHEARFLKCGICTLTRELGFLTLSRPCAVWTIP